MGSQFHYGIGDGAILQVRTITSVFCRFMAFLRHFPKNQVLQRVASSFRRDLSPPSTLNYICASSNATVFFQSSGHNCPRHTKLLDMLLNKRRNGTFGGLELLANRLVPDRFGTHSCGRQTAPVAKRKHTTFPIVVKKKMVWCEWMTPRPSSTAAEWLPFFSAAEGEPTHPSRSEKTPFSANPVRTTAYARFLCRI